MEYKIFGKTGQKVSSIGMGTYYDPAFITARKLHLKGINKTNVDAVKSGIDNGINLIDTAELYGTEEVVRDAISDKEREKLFIATKAFPNHLKPSKLRKACLRSLEKLGTSYIDLYQIHFPSHFVPISETMKEMEKLVDDGKIRYIGISNFDLAKTKEAVSVMKKHEIVSTQMSYNLFDRDIEENGLLNYCKENGMAVLAYYPLAHGKLVNIKGTDSPMAKIIESHKGAKPVHVALNWLLSRGENVFPIPRASRSDHVIENSKFDSYTLSNEDLDLLKKITS